MNYLKKYRIKNGLSQEELGAFLDASQPTIQRWETSDIPKGKISKICEVLQITKDQLKKGVTTHSISPYEENINADTHYGQVHLSFLHGENAFYPISLATMTHIIDQINNEDSEFLLFETQNNRTVFVVNKNLVDIRFSSDEDDGACPYMNLSQKHTFFVNLDDIFWDYVREREIMDEEDFKDDFENILDEIIEQDEDNYDTVVRYSSELEWQVTTGEVDSTIISGQDLLETYGYLVNLKQNTFDTGNGNGLNLINIATHGDYHYRTLLNVNHVNMITLPTNRVSTAKEDYEDSKL